VIQLDLAVNLIDDQINCKRTPLPIGVQVIGLDLEDRTVLAFAADVEREFDGFVPPPGYA